MIRRLLYLIYYFKNLDWSLMCKFMNYVTTKNQVNQYYLWLNVLYCSLKYNISLLEYFQFGFYDLNKSERKKWAGTGFMYEFQKLMNPTKYREVLDDKLLFAKKYGALIRHLVFGIDELVSDEKKIETILSNPSGKLVFKESRGKCGKSVAIGLVEEFDKASIISYMRKNGFDLVEEFIVQHPSMSSLSPSAVNTVRIFTQLDENKEVIILGCRLRISINSIIDNLAAGNAAAAIDENTGRVTGVAVFSDITKEDIDIHPVTGIKITGFQIPFWSETVEMAYKAALMHPQNRSIGWDIAITATGPDLIEGNHDWCKLLWQLPVKKGLKEQLIKYI